MNYEQKYKKALERARKIHDEILNQELLGFPDQIREIFPELAESEDERIRKGIIEIIKAVSGPDRDVYLDEKKQEKYLAWLEKQKEQKVDIDKLRRDIYQSGYNDGYQHGKEDTQKEQKPGEDSEYRKAYLDGWNARNLRAAREQKPAEWSTYDKATIEYVIEDIKELRDEETDEEEIETYDRELNLLQCINDSVKLCNYTNPAEWSEEDEDMLNCCISSIEEAKENRYAYKETDGDTSYDREIAFLKSLRPSWKPSEEQMEALKSTMYDYL